MKIKMKITAALIAALAIFSTAGAAVAQSGYPDRAVKMVLGYPPAGPVDIIARNTHDGTHGHADRIKSGETGPAVRD